MITTISHLPMDLVQEILTRVPLKSMRVVRLTCKVWNAMFKSRSFIGKEEAAVRESEKSRMIVLRDYNVYLTSVFVKNPSTEPQGKLTFLNNSGQVKISQVFHCEGILLCILKYPDTRVVVWNPYLGQTRWIQTRYNYHGLDHYWYAIGYETRNGKSCRTHKILRFMQYYNVMKETWYEIYNFDSGIWTTLDVPQDWFIEKNCDLSVKGNTYWWAKAKKNNSDVDQIICFDFTREKFEPFICPPVDNTYPNKVYLSSVGDEKLAVFLEGDIDTIWITTKIDAKNVSWSKFMTMETRPYTISYGGFLRNTVSIFGEAGYFRELDLLIPSYKRHLP